MRAQAIRYAKRLGRRSVESVLRRLGYALVPRELPTTPELAPSALPPDFDQAAVQLWERVQPYTLTGPERVIALRDSVRYVVRSAVPGAFVECGVWRGGSIMTMALTLLELGCTDRDLYLFDTFGWIPRPLARDVDLWGRSALADWERYDREGASAADPAYQPLPLERVHELLIATGYPPHRFHFVVGRVEQTVPEHAPSCIAILRLDTDYYESTLHEMRHLYPRIEDRGVLLIDDYGHFRGAQEAVDEYFASAGEVPLLHRIDYSGRLVVAHRPQGTTEPSDPAEAATNRSDE